MGRTSFQKSAGGIIIDEGRVLLIRALTRTGELVWTFPKGRIEQGERTWEAALREVREETGYLCRLRRKLKTTSYIFNVETTKVHKRVYWFLLEPIRQAGLPNPREVKEIHWFIFSEAMEKLYYRSDRRLLETAIKVPQE